MPAAAASLNPTATGAAAGKGGVWAVVGKRLHILGRLVVKGREVVDAIWRGATAPGAQPPQDLGWATRPYGQAVRALRMARLLHARLVREMQKLKEGAETPTAILQRLFLGSLRRGAQDLKDLAEEFAEDERELERGRMGQGLEPERAMRADRPDSFDRLPVDHLHRYVMSRPVDALIEEICRALDVAPDWLAQVEAEWAQAQAAASAPDPAPPPQAKAPPQGRGRGAETVARVGRFQGPTPPPRRRDPRTKPG